jgi:hypothetical protein
VVSRTLVGRTSTSAADPQVGLFVMAIELTGEEREEGVLLRPALSPANP